MSAFKIQPLILGDTTRYDGNQLIKIQNYLNELADQIRFALDNISFDDVNGKISADALNGGTDNGNKKGL